jgi:hypothetical protein
MCYDAYSFLANEVPTGSNLGDKRADFKILNCLFDQNVTFATFHNFAKLFSLFQDHLTFILQYLEFFSVQYVE